MSLEYKKGDLFAAVQADQEKTPIVIAHVCNDKGGWGAGFVIPLSKAYPAVEKEYRQWHSQGELFKAIDFDAAEPDRYGGKSCGYRWWNDLLETGDSHVTGNCTLGEVQFIPYDEKIHVANMVAQTLGGKRPLFYNHLAHCMERVRAYASEESRIWCPMFGSGLAGGNWDFIKELIEDCWKERAVTVFVL